MLFAYPQDVTVEANQWAQFNCTVHCSSVGWYMAGHRRAIRDNSSVPVLFIKRSSDVKCTPPIEKTYFFEVYATEALNRSTVYCAAYMKRNQEESCCCGKRGRCYSRPALLTGEPVCNAAWFCFCLGKFLVFSMFSLKVLCPFFFINASSNIRNSVIRAFVQWEWQRLLIHPRKQLRLKLWVLPTVLL